MSEQAVEVERRGPVGWIWMNRPDVHNAFDAALIQQLTDAFIGLGDEEKIRVIVLAARGKSFSAGARIEWMREQGAASRKDNLADARLLAALFLAISESPKPTLARVQGAAIGGGVGLLAACDIAIGATTAIFATSEVRLGIIPAVISPYVVRAIGERQARRLFQTGERIDAAAAQRIGLLHEAVASEELDEQVHAITNALLAGAPLAQKAAKELIEAVLHRPINASLVAHTAERIAELRAQPEAAEGLRAFLEKRPAAWVERVSD